MLNISSWPSGLRHLSLNRTEAGSIPYASNFLILGSAKEEKISVYVKVEKFKL